MIRKLIDLTRVIEWIFDDGLISVWTLDGI